MLRFQTSSSKKMLVAQRHIEDVTIAKLDFLEMVENLLTWADSVERCSLMPSLFSINKL